MLSNPGLISPEQYIFNRPSYLHLPKNRAEAFDNWSQKIQDGNPFVKRGVNIVDRSKVHSFEDYKAEMENFANDYIGIMDRDQDGKISYDEFEAYHLDNKKLESTNLFDMGKEVLEYKKSLRTAYDRINLNQEEENDGLDSKEVANYFSIMDSANINHKANGNISKPEFERMSRMIQSDGLDGEYIEDVLERSYDQNYKEAPAENKPEAPAENNVPHRPHILVKPAIVYLK